MSASFEWDDEKATSNLKKHGVGFDEAKSVFEDDFAVTFFDERYSKDEQREITIGRSKTARLLLVVHTERGENIRIISVRKATKHEQKIYEQNI
jgi:uncharacterized protein